MVSCGAPGERKGKREDGHVGGGGVKNPCIAI